MLTLRGLLLAGLSSLALALTWPLSALAQVHVTPSIGMYLPFSGPLIEQPSPDGRPTLRKAQVPRPVFTARAAKWLSPHLALEGSLGYSPALVAVRSDAGQVRDVSAGLMLASARTVLRLTGGPNRVFSLHLTSGLGYVHRIGDAWEDTPAHPAFGVVLGGGAQAPLGFRNRLAFRIEVEDFLSWAEFEGLPWQAPARLYHDMVLSWGVVVPIGGPTP